MYIAALPSIKPTSSSLYNQQPSATQRDSIRLLTHLKMRPSSPSSSDSYGTSPSTAPSSPPPEYTGSYFLIPQRVSAAFLNTLPAAKATGDLFFYFQGSGAVKVLLAQAAEVLQDKTILEEVRWERDSAKDGDVEVVYYKTKADIPTVSNKSSVVLDAIRCESRLVSLSAMSCMLYLIAPQSSHADSLNVFCEAGLRSVVALTSTTLILYILERPPLTFPTLVSTPATTLNPTANPYSIPSLAEFERVWAIWDLISLGMIPQDLLHSKPIDLRHKPLFYIGHLPTFANILLSRLIRDKPVGPRAYLTIFERGIDPSVDDPEHCHSHSEVPEKDEDWPVIEDVLAYRDEVRERVIKRCYEEMERGERPLTRRMARTLMMVHEHDGFHVEVRSSVAICGIYPNSNHTIRCALVCLDPPLHAHPARRHGHAPSSWVHHPALGDTSHTMGRRATPGHTYGDARAMHAHARARRPGAGRPGSRTRGGCDRARVRVGQREPAAHGARRRVPRRVAADHERGVRGVLARGGEGQGRDARELGGGGREGGGDGAHAVRARPDGVGAALAGAGCV